VRLGRDCLKLHTRSHRHSILERFDAAVGDAMTASDRQGREGLDERRRAPRVASRRR
jgi:hypothetical protein